MSGASCTDWIEDLAGRGIAGGCSVSPPLYCPLNSVLRQQIAAFLVKDVRFRALLTLRLGGLVKGPLRRPFSVRSGRHTTDEPTQGVDDAFPTRPSHSPRFSPQPCSCHVPLQSRQGSLRGKQAHPTAQCVLLQAYDDFQNAVTGHSVTTFDAPSTPTGTFTFAAPFGNGDNQMTIFVATPDAARIFNSRGRPCDDGPFSSPNGGRSARTARRRIPASPGKLHGCRCRNGLDVSGGLISGYAVSAVSTSAEASRASRPATTRTTAPTTGSQRFHIRSRTAGQPGRRRRRPAATARSEDWKAATTTTRRTATSARRSARSSPSTSRRRPVRGVTALAPADWNVNGVFEPVDRPDRADLEFFGAADIVLAGKLSDFTGPASAAPPFPSYRLTDGLRDMAPSRRRTARLRDQRGLLPAHRRDVRARPAQHWDATVDEILEATGFALALGGPGYDGVQHWTLHLGDSFPDVTTAHSFYGSIEKPYHNGVTGGCAAGTYCPGDAVTRAEWPFSPEGEHGARTTFHRRTAERSSTTCPAPAVSSIR